MMTVAIIQLRLKKIKWLVLRNGTIQPSIPQSDTTVERTDYLPYRFANDTTASNVSSA
jgi:hypothetical protein